MDQKVRVSVVSYLNSKPFAYGLQNHDVYAEIELAHDHPAACADKLKNGSADIGLIPVAAIPGIPGAEIISDFCISADGRVDSVIMISDVPLHEIRSVNTDPQSRTSNRLAGLLASHYWKINPQWIGNGSLNNSGAEAAVVIGDRALQLYDSRKYCFDLSEEWKKMTGLPFVFACWVSNRKLPEDFIYQFNQALQSGVESIDRMVEEGVIREENKSYLKDRIQYRLNADKRKAIEMFLELSNSMQLR